MDSVNLFYGYDTNRNNELEEKYTLSQNICSAYYDKFLVYYVKILKIIFA